MRNALEENEKLFVLKGNGNVGKCLDTIFSLSQTSTQYYQYGCFTFRLFTLVSCQKKVYAGVNFGKIIRRCDGTVSG